MKNGLAILVLGLYAALNSAANGAELHASPKDWRFGPEKLSGSVGYQVVTYRPAGLQFIRLTWLPDGRTKTKINALLDAQRRYAIGDHLGDRAAGLEAQNSSNWGYRELKARLIYTSPTLFIVRNEASIFSGARTDGVLTDQTPTI